MTFSFTLVLGLFLLAPGLAVFAAVYHGIKLGPVESPPPPPASILALSVITFGAMIAHLAGALVFLLQDFYCDHFACLRVGYEANIYASLFNLAIAKGRAVNGPEVAAVLLALVMLTVVAFAGARLIVRAFAGERALKGMLYGWLAEVAIPVSYDDREKAQSHFDAVLAYVISDVQDDGAIVGYEGLVANMTTNAEKEITSILLDSCEVFYLRVNRSGVSRRKSAKGSDIGQVYLDRSHIKNIAFERVIFANLNAVPAGR